MFLRWAGTKGINRNQERENTNQYNYKLLERINIRKVVVPKNVEIYF